MTGVASRSVLVGVVVAVVGAAVAAGIVLIGPPGEERARRIDNRRVEDLGRISSFTRLYYMRHQRLPASLAELAAEPGVTPLPDDPVTRVPYDYRVVDAGRFELCAVFDRVSTDGRAGDFWSHGAGRQCFTLEAKESRQDRTG